MIYYERPYIVLNGVWSKSIDGLMVCSLPPIRKPAMRYTSEEIDGVDGDVITELGYKAYDKTVEIGLCGDYNIDKVIEFFASSGNVTFSNEPDKYYLYRVLDAIDFERLVRYRKAEVKFHVQPYKHSVIERAKTWEISDQIQSVKVRNSGNTNACPTITVEGSGSVTLYLDGVSRLAISMPGSGAIRIDVAAMNAYHGDSDSLANRLVTGEYSTLALKPGTSTLSWVGNVTRLGIDNYSRWI